MTMNPRRRLGALIWVLTPLIVLVWGTSSAGATTPSGTLLYHANEIGQTPSVYELDLGTGVSELLIENAVGAQWSPDGSQIAYQRRIASTPDSDTVEIRVQKVDGTNDRLVTTVTSRAFRWYGWDPNGQHLLYMREPEEGICWSKAYRIDLDGLTEELVLDPVALTADDISVYGISFDESGTQIVWASQDGCSSGTLEIYRADYDDGAIDPVSVVQLTSNGSYEDLSTASIHGGRVPFWRAVGSAFGANDFEIHVMDLDGQNVSRITTDSERDTAALMSPAGDFVVYASWEQGEANIFVHDLTSGIDTPVVALSGNEVPSAWKAATPPEFVGNPGGSVLFSKTLDGLAPGIYERNLTTGDEVLLAEDAQQAAWSPDRSHMAYLRPLDDSRAELRIVGADGSDDRLVHTIETPFYRLYGWSPSGERLIYGRQPGGNSCASFAYSIGLDGTGEQLFLDLAVLTPNDISVYGVAFDESRTTVIWSSQDGCWSPTLELYSAQMTGDEVDASTVTRLTDNGVYEDLGAGAISSGSFTFWRAVGASFENSSWDIFVGSTDGSEITPIPSTSGQDFGSVLSPNADFLLYATRPDSQADPDVVMHEIATGASRMLLESSASEVPLLWSADDGAPVIRRVADVGNDQGRQVRVSFSRSSFDAAGSTSPILQYEIYRRIDTLSRRTGSELDRVIRLAREQGMVTNATILAQGWDYVGSLPAHGDPMNHAVAPTLADSTDAGITWTTFMVRAATPEPLVYYQSMAGRGYSVDNLAPAPPAALAAIRDGDDYVLTWTEPDDTDIRAYRVYAGTDGSLIATKTNRVAEVNSTTFRDAPADGRTTYAVTAVDFAGNESQAVTSDASTGVAPVAARLSLEQNVPNPFNPRTAIRFVIPNAGHATLVVYDSRGRVVRSLVDREIETGTHSVVWGGTDRSGVAAASGVYFAELRHGGAKQTIRMVLAR